MLNPLEKVLLSLASVVLSNRYMRNLFVLYAMGLHFVVLATLYSWTTDLDSVRVIIPSPSI
jgi:homeobox protein cut-like